MPVLTWTSNMSVGSTALDADHQALLDLVLRLDKAVRARESFEVIASLLTVSIELTEAHVHREEDIMRRLGCTVDAEHAHAHKAFLTWSHRLLDEFTNTRDQERIRGVIPVIRDWWHHHVFDQDMADHPVLAANAERVEAMLADSSLAEPILDSSPLRWPRNAGPVLGLNCL